MDPQSSLGSLTSNNDFPVRRRLLLIPSLATNTVKMVTATLELGNESEDQTMIHLVSQHIPDIVLNTILSQGQLLRIPSIQTYECVTLLFLDVSGFTALTEQYSNDAHLGIDQLTRTLNSYFEILVSEILIHSGDIYKFAGDAILALWTNQSRGPEQALLCALSLQQKFGCYDTDVGVVLRLKIALAYGSVRALFVGTEDFRHYILTGDCVKEVNRSEQICEPGEIILTRSLFEQVKTTSIDCEFVSFDDSNEHFKVKSTKTIVRQRIDHRSSMSTEEYLTERIDQLMKSFLLRCVSQRIERRQSLDYLSELRRVTISFINLNLFDEDEQDEDDDHCANVQEVFVKIYDLTKRMGGVLTKALLFDKGWSFLCVFGLPGYKQGDDTANALKCAQMIHRSLLNECSFIHQCSIGVATGLTYCGVVGHSFARCEYTVIGRKVNMAARLMCNYPNMISCDQETYYNSRLHSRFFQILPDKILKGMHNVGIIWQYGEFQTIGNNSMIESVKDRQEIYPLLGRRFELMFVVAQIVLLSEPIDSSHPRRDLAAILFEGEDQIGRTRLLQFIADCLSISNSIDENEISNDDEEKSSTDFSTIRLIYHSCQFEQRFNEFSLFSSLLRQLFHFQSNEKTTYEREQYLLKYFDVHRTSDCSLKKNLFLFNDFLNVNFRRTEIDFERSEEKNVFQTYETIIDELLLHFLTNSLRSNRCSKIIFIIDDIHFADESSLKHLLTFGSHSQCLLILSMKPPSNNNNDRPASKTLQSIRTDSRVYLRRLPGLELRYLATLACQILGVQKLPAKLVKLLNENCNGIPGFCEQILVDLLRKEKISIVENDVDDANLVEGDADKLVQVPQGTKMSLLKTLFNRRRTSANSISRVCILRDPNSTEFDADCQQNFQNYLMCRIDRLSECESLLVKIAAVIGNTFSRSFLWHLVDPASKKLINIHSSILDLMQRMVIECAYQHQQISKKRSIRCFCLQNPGGFPSQCRLMAFTHVSIRDGIYTSLTDSLKRLLIRQAIDYLEKQTSIVCLTCQPRTEPVFFVQKHDGLTREMKSSQQHSFVEIVQMAALKEIDHLIKQSIRIRSTSSPSKPRSNTSTQLPTQTSNSTLASFVDPSRFNGKKVEEKRRNSFDSCRYHHHRHATPTMIDDRFHRQVQRSFTNQSNKISTDVAPRSMSLTPTRSTPFVNRLKTNRFRAFFRYIFCQSVPRETIVSTTKTLDNDKDKVIKRSSHWRKVRQALLVTRTAYLEQPIFSVDLRVLRQRRHLIRTFENLYEQSLKFVTFQSFVQYEKLIEFVEENNERRSTGEFDLNRASKEFISYNDLRLCQCVDYLLTVYMKLIEYHTNLYDVDDLRSKQFDRIMFYRTEICRLLIHCHSFQRLVVEIEHGRKFQRFQSFLVRYTYDLFEAIVLYRTNSIGAAKYLVEKSLLELHQYEIETFETFGDKYRFEYLLCQYYLLQYRLSRHQSISSIEQLIQRRFHRFPLSFSVPCAFDLLDHFFSQSNYRQCSILIDDLIEFWWNHVSSREKLELGKLKTISLIIELKQGSLESAILSGYFAKRLLTGYHENIFLIETCIHLTLALIGEMRISNIELILQHLEYLSEQTMNCYAKLWYYILVIDVAIELGYELIPISFDLIENIRKYRQKLFHGAHQRSLVLIYTDCTLAQISARLGRLMISKKHFHHALHQIRFNQMYLSDVDFRFQRSLLKLVETQLIYWFYSSDWDDEQPLNNDSFLLYSIEEYLHDRSVRWNQTRWLIYRSYYHRLCLTHHRSVSMSWRFDLEQAEKQAIKLDREWIQRLRIAWSSTQTMPCEQTFIDWRLFLSKTSLAQFQLYLLPVKVFFEK